MFRFCKILLFISATYIGHGQINESFDALSENAYGNYIYNGFGVFNGLSNSTNALSGNCIRLRDDTSSLEYIGLDGNGKDGGVGEISFWYRSWDSSPTAIYNVEVSIAGGAYMVIGSQINSNSTTYNKWSYSLNDSNDDIKIKVSWVSGERLHIDDFEISNYSNSSNVDWANLQSPATGNTNRCNEYLVYARINVDGVTNNSGESGDIEAWIGYSTTNTDPSTWASSNWVSAGFFAEYGNDDEYRGDLGPELDTDGTYYYASRFRYDGGPYAYGGYNAGGGGFWDGSSNISGQVTIINEQPNFANVDYPASGNIDLCNSLNVYAQVYEPGMTDASGQGDNISAWIGYNSISSTYDVTSDTGWTWVEATYDSDQGNNDQYIASIGSDLPPGTYYYASRFQINCNDYSYGGIVSDNYGNFWGLPVPPGNVDVPYSGVLTVNNPGTANVVISEIMYSTSGVDDEWIEICNVSGSSQDLSFYQIHVGGGLVYSIPCGTQVLNNDCITISLGDGGGSEYNVDCPFTPDLTNGFGNGTLNNTGDIISVYTANGTTLVDEVTYSNVDGANGNGSSLHIIDITQDNSNSSINWQQVDLGGSSGVNALVPNCLPNVADLTVEGNIGAFPDIQDGDNTPSGLDNTLYSAQFISDTQTKSFLLHSEGAQNIIVSSINLIGDVTDFQIVQVPSEPIAYGTPFLLEITFNPQTEGIKTAIVEIINNDDDLDEQIYTFTIQGEGLCFVDNTEISPESGPAGTVVTINGINFNSASVTFNELSVPVTLISNNEIEIEIPDNSISGNIEILDAVGCTSIIPFDVIDRTISGCGGNANPGFSELFISELTDATFGNLTMIELYNPSNNDIDLSNYSIRIYSNGSTTNYREQNLSGILQSNYVYLIAAGTSGAQCIPIVIDDYDLISNVLFGINAGTNSDDYVGLFKNGTLIDEWGYFGNNNWTANTPITGDRGFDFRRLNTAANLPSLPFSLDDWNVIDWVGSGSNSCDNNDYSDIGLFDYSTGNPPDVSLEPVIPADICSASVIIYAEASEGQNGGDGLNFQWFELAPGDDDWTPISNDGVNYTIISASNSSTVEILNSLNKNNYQYYCQVQEDDNTCFTASDAVRLSLLRTYWNGSSWSSGTPDINTIAIISGDYNTNQSSSFSACQLIIESNYSLNIANSDYVEVENNIYANGSVVVESSGALVQNSENSIVEGTGIMRVNKTTSVLETLHDYTYWSSPVHEPEIGTTALVNANPERTFWFNAQYYEDRLTEIGNTGTYSFGPDDIDDDGNDWILAAASSNMINGLGYAATHNSSLYTGSGQYPYSFTGKFNTGPISVDIYRNDATSNDTNWNLVGNPYPSAISIMDFFDANTFDVTDNPTGAIDGALYIWSQSTLPSSVNSGNQQINFSNDDYFIVNSTGIISPNTDGDQLTDPYIPSGQAFFISMSDDPGVQVVNVDGTIKSAEVSFTNAMRHTGHNNEFFRNPDDIGEFNKIWLNINVEDGMLCQTLIGFLPTASAGYDGARFDAKRHLSSSKPALLYSTIEGDSQKFGIQGRAQSDLTTDEIIPLGFESKFDSPVVFNISIDHYIGDFMEAESIYIIDQYLNIAHNLKDSNYYFTSESGVFLDRFLIGFSDALLSIPDDKSPDNQLLIYPENGNYWTFKINGPSPIIRIHLYDLLGRLVYDLHPNNYIATYNLPSLSNSPFIARVELSNMAIFTKKVIKY